MPRFFVDVPNPQELRGAWVNVAEFETRDKALAYARETLGADEDGRIGLLSVLESEEDDQAVPA